MKPVLGLVVLLACGSVKQQPPSDAPDGDDDAPPVAPGSFIWQQNMFGSFPAVTLAGDEVYVSASQFAPLDLGGGILVPAGGQDVLVARFGADGVHRSSWRHGGTSDEFQIGMSVDPFGNVDLAALYRGIGNAGATDLPAANGFAGYLASYMPDGTFRWQAQMHATGELFPRNASTNGSGNAGAGGHFIGTIDLGAGITRVSAGGKDAYYLRVNDTGGVATISTFGGAGDDTANAAIFDSLGTVILVGTFTGTVTFGTFTLDAGSGRDLFVMRMSIQGVPMWAIQGGGTMDVGDLPSAAVAPNGDVVIAADFSDRFTLTGGQEVSSAGAADIVLARISSAGVPLWTKAFGGAGQDRIRAVATGPRDEIALAGEFNGQATFGGSTFTSAGFIDAVVAKYDAGGTHVFSRAAGSAADDRGLGVAIDASGSVYFTASFHNTVEFGGPLTANGTEFNGVLVKYAP